MSDYGTDVYNEIAYGNTLSTEIWDIGVWGGSRYQSKRISRPLNMKFGPATYWVAVGENSS